MTALGRSLGPGTLPARWRLAYPAGALILAIGGAALGYTLSTHPPPLSLVVAACIGLSAILALAIARYEVAVALGVLLLGVVRFEPAPPDAIFAVVIAVAVVTGRLDLERVPLGILAILASFFTLNIFSAVEAVDPGRAMLYMMITLYLIVFSVWFAGYANSADRVRTVVKAYILGATLMALYSTMALFLPVPSRELFLFGDLLRAQGLFEDPNVYGPFLVPAALILLEELINPRLILWRPTVKTLTIFILVMGITFSYSRAAWVNMVIAALVMLGILALRRGGSRRALTVLVVLSVGGVIAFTIVSATGSVGFLQERATLQSYDTDRFAAQRTGIELAFQKPFGIGPGQFEIISPVATHSTYVRALAEQGLLGFFLVLSLLLGTLILATRNAFVGRDSYGIGSAALLGAWIGILVNSAVVDSGHWRHLWFVAALIWVGALRHRRDPFFAA